MKYEAKVHYRNGLFTTYVKGECELDEDGNPRKDKEYLYLLSGLIRRKDITSLEIIPVEDD